jgi:hypothetical protein
LPADVAKYAVPDFPADVAFATGLARTCVVEFSKSSINFLNFKIAI